jgi:hypothetical protein
MTYGRLRAWRLIVLMATAFLCSPTLAATDIGRLPDVRAGEKAVVRSATVKIDAVGADHGTVAPPENVGKFYNLTYAAPADMAGKTAKLTWKEGDQDLVGTVAITPAKELYEDSFKSLFKLFVIAVVLEQALALIFNWKPFLEVFDRRATKPLVSMAFAVALVTSFDLDILAEMLSVYAGKAIPGNLGSLLVTSLVLAGGSSAVNNILKTLGLRTAPTVPPAERPADTKAWLAVLPTITKAAGMITVAGVDAASVEHVLGTIQPPTAHHTWPRFLGYFFKNQGRFPQSGGFEIDPGQWTIKLRSTAKDGTALPAVEWGPYTVNAGAIINLYPVI